VVYVRVTAAEHRKLKADAELQGLPMQVFARASLGLPGQIPMPQTIVQRLEES